MIPKTLFSLLIFISLFLLTGFSTQSEIGYKWQYLGTTQKGSFFYDENFITTLSTDLKRVWTLVVFNDEAIEELKKEFDTRCTHQIFLVELNNKEKTVRTLLINIFSENTLIGSINYESEGIMNKVYIPSNTKMSELIKKVFSHNSIKKEESKGNDRIQLGSNSSCLYSYRESDLLIQDEYKIMIKIRTTYTKKGLSELEKNYPKHSDTSYIEMSCFVDCKNQEFYILDIIDYDKRDKIINYEKNPTPRPLSLTVNSGTFFPLPYDIFDVCEKIQKK